MTTIENDPTPEQGTFMAQIRDSHYAQDLVAFSRLAEIVKEHIPILDKPSEEAKPVFEVPSSPLNGTTAYMLALKEAGVQIEFVSGGFVRTPPSSNPTDHLAIYAFEEDVNTFHTLSSQASRTFSSEAVFLASIYGGGDIYRTELKVAKSSDLELSGHMTALLLTAPKLGRSKIERFRLEDLRIVERYDLLARQGRRPLNPEQIHGLAMNVLEGMLAIHAPIKKILKHR